MDFDYVDDFENVEMTYVSFLSRGYISKNKQIFEKIELTKFSKFVLSSCVYGTPIFKLGDGGNKILILSGIHGNELSPQIANVKLVNELIDIDLNNTNLPKGSAKDLQAECDRYNALLEKYQQDVQVLGLGSNGHIGFNEPGTPFDSVTHLVDLTENTIKDNSRLFNSIDEVPKQALSMGIKNIMQAKSILMVVSGKNKAEAVRGMVKGEITPDLPASVLQLHPFVTIICDKDAASLL
jgi:hypothetical protein